MKNIKNLIIKKKFGLTVIVLILVLIVLIKILTATMVLAEDITSVPSLFYNDAVFVFSIWGSNYYMPIEQVNGDFYIPLAIFRLLNDINIDTMDDYTENFYIQYGNNYIAFKISADRAQVGINKYISCKVYKLNNTTYVPAQIVAQYLGLEWEYKSEYNTGRIKQSDAIKSFDDLLEKYIPKPQPTTPPPTDPPKPPTVQPVTPEPTIDIDIITTSAPAAIYDPPTEPEPTSYNNPAVIKPTEPTTPAPTTTAENTREIQNYLMFYESSFLNDTDERITDVLKLLDKTKMRAVFFFSADEITQNPDILRKVYASGHDLGIKFTDEEIKLGPVSLVSVLESANDLIYSALKHRTRFCMFDESVKHSGNDEYFEQYKEEYENTLIERGYYLCKNTVDIFSLSDTDVTDTNEMIEFLKQKRVNVFMFDLSGSYRNYLELSAKAAEAKFYINFSYINNANIETVKRQTNINSNLNTNTNR